MDGTESVSPPSYETAGKEQLPTNSAISEQYAKQCDIKAIKLLVNNLPRHRACGSSGLQQVYALRGQLQLDRCAFIGNRLKQTSVDAVQF